MTSSSYAAPCWISATPLSAKGKPNYITFT